MTTETAGKNPLSLSDEDFLNSFNPSAHEQQEPVQETSSQETAQTEEERVAAEQAAAAAQSEENEETVVAQPEQKDSKTEESSGNVPAKAEVPQQGADAATVDTDPSKATAKDAKGEQKPGDAATTDKPATADTEAAPVNYEAEYKRVLAPFKANGKMIEPRSIDEAIQLMQMGANYTRKMQEIQPHRKTLLLLEKSGLMDPDKLSFLIDLDQGNPAAIQKFMKDRNIDPMSVDTSEDSNYLGGNHKVSDEEVNFRTILDDIGSDPDGQKTLHTVNSTWDQASKEVLWKEPQIMQVIHDHRQKGFYDLISAEVEHQQRLGAIPAGTPFIQAYKAVGDMLQAQGKLVPPSGSAAAVTTAPAAAPEVKAPVATRVATPKPAVTNGDAASAAAATRSTPRKTETVINPLAMSDDEFLKQMANRV